MAFETESVSIDTASPGIAAGDFGPDVTSGGTFGGDGPGGGFGAAHDPGLAADVLASTRAPGAADLLEGPPTELQQQRRELAAFAEFQRARDTFGEKLGAFLGFGPDATSSVKRGAELADPSAFSAGVKTGLGFETAAALSSLGGLPTSVAVGIVDRIASVAASPAFAAGRASINNPLSKVAPVAGTAAGVAAQSIGLARAVELGLSVAGVAAQVPGNLQQQAGEPAVPERTLSEDSGAGSGADTARQVAQHRPRQPALGATVTSTITQDFERQRRTLATREQLGRSALTVRRV